MYTIIWAGINCLFQCFCCEYILFPTSFTTVIFISFMVAATIRDGSGQDPALGLALGAALGLLFGRLK